MLSFDGWSVAIVYIFKIVVDTIFFLYVIFKGKKNNFKLLYFPAIGMFSVAIAHVFYIYDFFHILLTGTNILISDFNIFIISSLFQICALTFLYLGINLTLSERRKIFLLILAIYVLFFQIATTFIPNAGVVIEYPPFLGENLIKIYIKFNSILFYLLIPYGVVFVMVGLGIFLKILKMRGKIRKKYITIALGYIIGGIFVYSQLFSQNVGFLYALYFVVSLSFIWVAFIYGMTPVREKSPKKKRIPSKMQLKFASYLSKKSGENLSLEGEIFPASKINQEILIFMSYATKDADFFKVKEIAEKLTKSTDIQDVLYWQEDMGDNIIEYMNDNLGRCHAMILFCSKAALESIPVKKEWTAAEAVGLPIIPVFYDVDHIPTLLKSRLGVEFDFYDLDRNVLELHSLILKKCGRFSE